MLFLNVSGVSKMSFGKTLVAVVVNLYLAIDSVVAEEPKEDSLLEFACRMAKSNLNEPGAKDFYKNRCESPQEPSTPNPDSVAAEQKTGFKCNESYFCNPLPDGSKPHTPGFHNYNFKGSIDGEIVSFYDGKSILEVVKKNGRTIRYVVDISDPPSGEIFGFCGRVDNVTIYNTKKLQSDLKRAEQGKRRKERTLYDWMHHVPDGILLGYYDRRDVQYTGISEIFDVADCQLKHYLGKIDQTKKRLSEEQNQKNIREGLKFLR